MSHGWAFAFSKRWAAYLALAIVFAIVCCLLGAWQLNRRAEARVEIDRFDANYASEPVPLADELTDFASFDPDSKWTPIVVEGRYLHDEELLVRARPYNGSPGFEVLTPLQLADGSIVIVDRGWVSPGSRQDTPDAVPRAPDGVVTVVARLKAAEPALPNRSAPPGQVATIELSAIATLLSDAGLDAAVYTGAYGLMVSESPATESRPLAPPKPVRDEGPHLSYALQWFVFAIFGFIGLGYALRQEYRVVNVDDPEERERAEQRRIRDSRRERSDSEIEDELVDAAR